MHSRVQSLRAEPQARADDRSVAQLLADLLRNLQDILGAEISLAQARVREELRAYRPTVILMVVGALGGILGCFFLLLAAVAALSRVVPVWAAALIVGAAMAIICVILLRVGVSRLRSGAARLAQRIERMKE
ncbi:MAG: phage holin family protein [Gammaproteobacteria bacterium]|nr:phage holin family protein [Gammaproteobacteria bacterium]